MRHFYDWKGSGRYYWKGDFPAKTRPKRFVVVKAVLSADPPPIAGAPKGHLDSKKN